MRRLIGIRIPSGIEAEIAGFCKRYQCDIVDFYITMVRPEMLKGVNGLARKLQTFSLSQPPVKIIMGGPSIKDGNKLYLTVLPGALTSVRDRLLAHLNISPQEELYRPYVSLIAQRDGLRYDFEQILADAKNTFNKPHSIDIERIALYTQAGRGLPFNVDKSYPFTGR